jgi:hypothetical protein
MLCFVAASRRFSLQRRSAGYRVYYQERVVIAAVFAVQTHGSDVKSLVAWMRRCELVNARFAP